MIYAPAQATRLGGRLVGTKPVSEKETGRPRRTSHPRVGFNLSQLAPEHPSLAPLAVPIRSQKPNLALNFSYRPDKVDDVNETSPGPHRREISLIVELDHGVMGTAIEALVLVEDSNAVPTHSVEVSGRDGCASPAPLRRYR